MIVRIASRFNALIASVVVVTASAWIPAFGADAALRMPFKAPLDNGFDWTGFYVGAHGGYATGFSRWSATEAGGASPSLTGSLDFFKAFDGFKGTGSYFTGLHSGYNRMFPSRWVQRP